MEVPEYKINDLKSYKESFWGLMEHLGYKPVNPEIYKIYVFENQIFRNKNEMWCRDYFIRDGELYRIPFGDEPIKLQEQLDVVYSRRDKRMSYINIDFQHSKYKNENDIWILLSENMMIEMEKEKQELENIKERLENQINVLKGNVK